MCNFRAAGLRWLVPLLFVHIAGEAGAEGVYGFADQDGQLILKCRGFAGDSEVSEDGVMTNGSRY